MARIDIRQETGTTPESVAKYLLRQKGLDDVPRQYRARLEGWIVNENGQDKYEIGASITIPDDGDILKTTLVPLPLAGSETAGNTTEVPPPQIEGWKLTKVGLLVMGMSGYLIDENNLYILRDGRRISNAEFENDGNRARCFGNEKVAEGLADILGKVIQPGGGAYDTAGLLNDADLVEKMPLVVFQALQINACYNRGSGAMSINTNKAKFYSIGKDETDIPIVVTCVGNENAVNKLVIASPHGDERNAQRLIMAAQKYFIKEGAPADMVYYFVPCISPTMAFADARGIPVVNKNNVREPSIKQLLDDYRTNTNGKNIPYLHDLIAMEVPITPNSTTKRLLRTSIQNHNGSAFATFDDYKNGRRNQGYPIYGIDSNRDVEPWLDSTKCFIAFMERLCDSPGAPDNIKVFMVHGYKDGGGVFGTYDINLTERKAELLPAARDMAYAFWAFLFGGRPEDFYGSTRTLPHNYVGEWNQILYRRLGVLSVDIELPDAPYDEGRRGELPPDGNYYKPDRIKEDFGDDGVLIQRRDGFFRLLETYPSAITDYKNQPIR